MGIFTKKTPEEIELEKQKEIKKTLEKYGLDLENYTIQDIVKKNRDNLRNIASELVAIGFHKVSVNLSLKSEEKAKISYLSVLSEQNWILIRQNEIIIKQLQQLNNK